MKNFITLRDNGVRYGTFPKKQLAFLKKALRINEGEKRAFCVHDFRELTSVNFRQYIHKLQNYIEILIPSYPKFYKIKGVNLTTNFKPISGKTIGDSVLTILEKQRDQSVTLNDLKIQFDSSNGLYNVLVNFGAKTVGTNQEIHWHHPCIHEDNVELKIKIDPQNVNIEINCEHRPIVYDMNTVLKITELLGIISHFINNKSRNIIKIPYVGDWLCVSYSIGTNGQYHYDDPQFCETWKDIAGGFLRVYAKQSKNQRFNMLMDTRMLQ